MGQGSKCYRTVYLNRSMWFYTSQTDSIYTVGRVTTDRTVKTHFAASKTESQAHTRGSYVWDKGSKIILKGGKRSGGGGEEKKLYLLLYTMKQIQSESPEKGRMATAHCSALPVVDSKVEHKSQKGFGEWWQSCKAFRLKPPFATWCYYSEKTSKPGTMVTSTSWRSIVRILFSIIMAGMLQKADKDSPRDACQWRIFTHHPFFPRCTHWNPTHLDSRGNICFS